MNAPHKALLDARALVALLEGINLPNVQTPHHAGLSPFAPSELDERISKLMEAVDSLKESLTGQIAEARRWRNAQLPIHRKLPLEIFVRVVDWTLGGDRDPKALIPLSAVCQSWRTTIEGTPSLWTGIHSWNHPDLINKALVQSTKAPLDITFFHDSTEDGFSARVAPHLSRCRSAVLWLELGTDIAFFIPQFAPLLEKLEIEVEVSDDSLQAPVIHVSNASTPRLRHLDVTDARLRFGTISNLRLLRTCNTEETSLSIHDLLEILRSNPELRNLDITCVRPTSAPFHDDSSPIHLPHLRSIYFGTVPLSDYARLVPLIQAPELRSFANRPFTLSSATLAPLLQQTTQMIAPFASLKGRVVISSSGEGEAYWFSTSVGPGEDGRTNDVAYSVNLTLRTSLDNELFKLIMDILFRNLLDVEVTVHFQSQEARTPWKNWLAVIPHITQLTLPHTPIQRSVIQYLSLRGQNGWPCPELTKLNIDARVESPEDAVFDMIIRRYQTHPGEKSGLPKDLEKLVVKIHSGTDGEWQEVKSKLGEDRVLITDDLYYQWNMDYP